MYVMGEEIKDKYKFRCTLKFWNMIRSIQFERNDATVNDTMEYLIELGIMKHKQNGKKTIL